MIIKPIGQITTIDAATITAGYPSGNSQVTLTGKEILRASTVRIDNRSDTVIVARVVEVNALNTSTGEPFSIGIINNVETFNHYDVIVKPEETIYIRKVPMPTTLDNPNTPTYVNQPVEGGQTINLLLAEGSSAGTGSVYASPVTIQG